MTEQEVIDWFSTRSSGSIRRVVDAGEAMITERIDDGVME